MYSFTQKSAAIPNRVKKSFVDGCDEPVCSKYTIRHTHTHTHTHDTMN